MRIVSGIAVLGLMYAFNVSVASATTKDLDAIYCIQVDKFDISIEDTGIKGLENDPNIPTKVKNDQLEQLEQDRHDMETALSNLQIYIAPRLPMLSPFNMAEALRLANSDISRIQQASASGCGSQCVSSSTLARVRMCRSLGMMGY